MQFKVIKRLNAEDKGLLYFYTGRECKWGHKAPRFTLEGASNARDSLHLEHAVAGICYECALGMQENNGMMGEPFETIMEDWDETTEDAEVSKLPVLSGTNKMGYKVVKESLVDTAQYPSLCKVLWIGNTQGYVVMSTSKENKRRLGEEHPWFAVGRKNIHMHRAVLGLVGIPSNKVLADHINGIRNDNRLCNLRPVSRTVNNRNSRKFKKPKGTTSIFKGVRKSKGRNKCWQSQHTTKGTYKAIGYYYTEVEAAEAYDNYLRSLNLEGATYNFPREGEGNALR